MAFPEHHLSPSHGVEEALARSSGASSMSGCLALALVSEIARAVPLMSPIAHSLFKVGTLSGVCI